MKEYSQQVYRSIMKRRLTLGVPTSILLGIIILTAVFFMTFESLIIMPFSIILWLILREITKKDEYAIEIFLSSLLQPSHLE